MRKALYLYLFVFSSLVHATEPNSLLSLESPATKMDVIIASLYGEYGCKEVFAAKPIGSALTIPQGHITPDLCLSDLNYLPNIKTIRMSFSISKNHYLVKNFDELNDENKLKTILDIATIVEAKADKTIKNLSLLFQSALPEMEFLVSYNGYRALRDRSGEIVAAKYKTNGF